MSVVDRKLEQGLIHLRALAQEAKRSPALGRNEAATRFDLIDALLLNVLAWPREQVRPEEYSAPGFADYVLGLPQRQLVVEAKREGTVFRLPPETPRIALLQTLFALDRELKATVEQAQRYASNLGLQYAAVCNGHQLVAFLATRIDGVEPLKGRALAFASIEDMEADFSLLWNGLSRPAVESRRLSAMLGGEGTPAPPPKVSTMIPGYPRQARADDLVVDLRMLGQLFLVDVPEQPDLSEQFLRDCYLPSGALSQHAAVGRDILRTRYAEPLEAELGVKIAPARTKRGIPPDLLADLARAGLRSRPIILLGWVGAGKTIFLRHLIRVDAKDVLTNAIVLYVNLGEEPALEQLRPYIADHFIAALQDTYGLRIFDRVFAEEVYSSELVDFDRGPYGPIKDLNPSEYAVRRADHLSHLIADREAHLRRSLAYLAETEDRQVVSILDNVDQRPPPVQDEVFLIAETLAKSWPGTVFVSLRPDTFNRSKREGTLSAYQPRVFAVSPPRIDRVLDKRLQFAHRQIVSPNSADALGRVGNSDALGRYLETIRLSLTAVKHLQLW